jgi:hypothetical protein
MSPLRPTGYEGAVHERDFWSQQIYDIAREFLDRNVK